MTLPGRDRGRVRLSAVLGLLGVIGLVLGATLIGLAIAAQVPDPPGPAETTLSSAQAHHGAPQQHRAAVATPSGPGGPAQAQRSGIPRPSSDPATPQGEVAGSEERAPQDPAGSKEPAAEDGATEDGTGPAGAQPARPASRPVEVRVPAIDVSGPLHPLGLAADGTLEVPTGQLVDEAAWYSGSPTPGERGPSVIEGHVTGATGQPSVFFGLGRLASGDLVEVDREDGSTVAFEVYRVDRYPKASFPTVQVYGPTPGPELRLITCGGDFDEGTGHHVDNTVVYAQLVAGP